MGPQDHANQAHQQSAQRFHQSAQQHQQAFAQQQHQGFLRRQREAQDDAQRRAASLADGGGSVPAGDRLALVGALLAVAIVAVAVGGWLLLGRGGTAVQTSSETPLPSTEPTPALSSAPPSPSPTPSSRAAARRSPPPPPVPAVEVPDVRGYDVEKALDVLDAEGLTAVCSPEVDGGCPSGTVLSQDPAPGDEAQPGDVVLLDVEPEPGEGEPTSDPEPADDTGEPSPTPSP